MRDILLVVQTGGREILYVVFVDVFEQLINKWFYNLTIVWFICSH